MYNSTTFQFVLVLDFTKSSTDEKLYARYGITKFKQKFVESLIKPMG